jgi:hypothetical protein
MYQGAVEPELKRMSEDERRDHGHADGQHDHRRRVIAGEPFHERLRWRALRLRLLHQGNDSCQRRVSAKSRHADFERAVAVDRSGEDFLPRGFLDGK